MVDPDDEAEAAGDEAIRAEIASAVQDVFARNGRMAGHWVFLAEEHSMMGRALWSLSDDDSKSWDTFGLLQVGIEDYRAKYMAEMLVQLSGDEN